MGLPDENSTYCRSEGCGMFNVEGYCDSCLAEFIKWIIKKDVKRIKNINNLWYQFIMEKKKNEQV